MSGGVAAVVLAAGRGLRFGAADATSKLVAPLAGIPLVRYAAEAALGSRATPVVIVTGHAEAAIHAALAGLPVQFAQNPAYASGLSTSLAAGVAALPDAAQGALILLGDMPRVTAMVCDRLIACFAEASPVDAVVPVHAGREGNPVLLGRSLFADVARLRGDAGARQLLAGPGRHVVHCDIGDDGIWLDVDTRQALRGLAARD